jgi:hypothetical protein
MNKDSDVLESVSVPLFDEPGLKFADPWNIGQAAAPGDPCGGRAVCPGDPCGGRAVCPGDPAGGIGSADKTALEFFKEVLGDVPSLDSSFEELMEARIRALQRI